MAQGDNIGECMYSNQPVDIVDIIPPAGQVWLITYLKKGAYTHLWLVDAISGTALDIGALCDNPNIRLFISDKLYLRADDMSYNVDNRFLIWNGIQFK